eukprot:2440225-Rhodomonas_salina.1
MKEVKTSEKSKANRARAETWRARRVSLSRMRPAQQARSGGTGGVLPTSTLAVTRTRSPGSPRHWQVRPAGCRQPRARAGPELFFKLVYWHDLHALSVK